MHPGEGCIQGRAASRGACIQGGWAEPPPPSDPMEYGQRAGSTHPTGMHSCTNFYLLNYLPVKCLTVTNWNGVENIFVAENQIFGIMKLQAFCSKKQENACESVKHSTDSAILKWALDFPLYICSIHLHALTTGHL